MSDIIDIGHKYRVAILIIIIAIIAIISTIIFISNYKGNNNNDIAVVLTEGDLVINYINGNEIDIKDKKEHTYNITIINNSDKVLFYSLNLDDIVATKSIEAKIYNEQDDIVSETQDALNDSELLSLVYINPQETTRYRLVMKNKISSEFKAKINIKNESESTQTFGDLILLNNPIKIAKTIPGKEASTTEEGLLTANDNDGLSYYFRGDINNNYVKMGDLYFRIIRINGNGSVRLILDTVLPTKYPYNVNAYQEDKGYTSLSNISTSSLMTILNGWYQENLSLYNDFISEDNFCIDNKFENVIGNLHYSNSYTRIYTNNEPSLTCFGETIKSKIGLITADEVAFSGATKEAKNNSYYLYNDINTGDYLTLSTYYATETKELTMINILEDGSIGNGILVTKESGIRPVININQNAKVKGKGTKTNPYIIVG